MDDTKNQQNQSQQGNVVQDTAGVQNSQVQQQTNTPSTPIKQEEWVLPTSGGKVKESEPMPAVSSAPTELVTPTETPVEISKEIAETGVEAVSEVPQLTEEDKKAGLEVAKESIPAPSSPAQSTQSTTPLTEEEVKKEVEGNPIFKDPTNARYWLAMLLQKYFAEKKKK